MSLEGTVKTPFGPMQKKTAMLVGGGGLVVVGVAYYRHQKAAQAAAAASTTTAATDAANATGIDPATGFPYGSAEDSAALAQMQGLNYGGGTLGAGGSQGQYPPGTGPPFSSNATWAQYCEQTMGSSGSDAIAAALGHYLTGSPLQSGEATIVDQAIAIGGYPPTAGPNGMPPGLNTNNPGGGQIAVPNVVGMETAAGDRAITAAGLQFSHSPLKGGVGSTITATSPAAGTMVAQGSTVQVTFKEK